MKFSHDLILGALVGTLVGLYFHPHLVGLIMPIFVLTIVAILGKKLVK